ncbi:maternal protein exuperantia [Nilaparvata lugens]|uniref:maternal protein exuperantia n=1 Tax=Nilaparvata lugens TaxID=108931 RepID=UPI00193D86A5|nr:maternal protein exuperantia [Nilaparvata lugens]
MVSPTESVSPSTTVAEKSPLPAGRFRLVGWDVDATGQMVTDEICQLAAHVPSEDFSQYIMPYKDLTIFAQRRYMMYTKTIGRFRALRDKTNHKMLRTKSEISALVDFLMWLEKIKNQEPGCTGLILLCHDALELAPLLLIQALKRYDLLDRFSSIVKGFGNCYAFVKLRCESSVTSFTLKTLSKVLLDKEDEQTHSAKNRARIAYQLVQHLRAGMVDQSGPLVSDLGELAQFTWTVADKEAKIAPRLELLQRHQSLVPLFKSSAERPANGKATLPEKPANGKAIVAEQPANGKVTVAEQPSSDKATVAERPAGDKNGRGDRRRSGGGDRRLTLQERRRAVQLRSQLIEAMIDYDTLQKTWTEGKKEKLVGLLESALSEWNEADRKEMVEIAVRHFECPPLLPKAGRRRRGSSKSSASAPQTPTSSSSSPSSPPPTNGHSVTTTSSHLI